VSQRLENEILELKSEIRASASRAKRDTGAAAASKSSIAGKIRHKRSGQVCKPVFSTGDLRNTIVFETSLYYESNTKSVPWTHKV